MLDAIALGIQAVGEPRLADILGAFRATIHHIIDMITAPIQALIQTLINAISRIGLSPTEVGQGQPGGGEPGGQGMLRFLGHSRRYELKGY